MKNYLKSLIGISVAFVLLSACGKKVPKVERAFYYWKNNTGILSKDEVRVLKEVKVHKLYVKFFEVAPHEVFNAVPEAKSQLHMYSFNNHYSGRSEEDSLLDKTVDSLHIVPTVYIRNSVFFNATQGSLDTLADNINFLINKYYKENYELLNRPFAEIQIDCDWTEKTKDNYFYLLTKIKAVSKKTLSCTLRLYPYKYSEKMGVPPVDKVTLMCYNLISPLKEENKNSILNNDELALYLKGVEDYPLHVDIALPVFYWIQVFQNNQFMGLISPEEPEFFDSLKLVKPMWYEVQKEMVCGSFFLRPGDQLKMEEVTEQTVLKTISLLKDHVAFDDSTTVTLFHLDKDNLKKYKYETLTRFYTDFSK